MDESLLKSRRFRFGLRTAFVLMTLVGLGFGYRAVQRRPAEQVAARHNAVTSRLLEKLSKPPAGFGSRHVLYVSAGEMAAQLNAATVLENGKLDIHTSASVGLDTTSVPARLLDKLLANLESHYSAGLLDLGFRREMSNRRDGHITTLWTARGQDLGVLIEISVINDGKSATVSLVFINNEKLDEW